MRHLFILNPKAGRADAAAGMEPKIRAAAEKAGIRPELIRTEYAGHAVRLARDAAERGESVRLYACGGDGTLNEVLTGAYRFANAEVAQIPCGSGNDMVRNFGTAQDFLDLPGLMRGRARVIDLIAVGDRIAASICSAGLDAKVAYQIPRLRRIPLCGGSTAYNLSLLKCLLEPMGYRWRVTADGRAFGGEYLLAAVGNGSYYGGGYDSVPDARMDDGILNVVLVRKMPLLRLAKVLGQYKTGAHFAGEEIIPELRDVMETFPVKELSIECEKEFIYTIDGECAPVRALRVRVLPAAARFVLPEKLCAHP